MQRVLRTGTGAVLVMAIMVIGSIVLWAGTPLAWLRIGAQIQGATQSLGTALVAAFAGVIVSILLLASLLARLSDLYRANCVARGLDDPGPDDLRTSGRGGAGPDALARSLGRHPEAVRVGGPDREDRGARWALPARRRLELTRP